MVLSVDVSMIGFLVELLVVGLLVVGAAVWAAVGNALGEGFGALLGLQVTLGTAVVGVLVGLAVTIFRKMPLSPLFGGKYRVSIPNGRLCCKGESLPISDWSASVARKIHSVVRCVENPNRGSIIV